MLLAKIAGKNIVQIKVAGHTTPWLLVQSSPADLDTKATIGNWNNPGK